VKKSYQDFDKLDMQIKW